MAMNRLKISYPSVAEPVAWRYNKIGHVDTNYEFLLPFIKKGGIGYTV